MGILLFRVRLIFRGAIRIPLLFMLIPRCRAMHPVRNTAFGEQAPTAVFRTGCAPLVVNDNLYSEIDYMRTVAYTQWIYTTLYDIKSTMRKHDDLAVKYYVEFYSISEYNLIIKLKIYINERKLILCQIYYLYQI